MLKELLGYLIDLLVKRVALGVEAVDSSKHIIII